MCPQSTLPCPDSFKQQATGMTNPYRVEGDYTIILLQDRKSEEFHRLIIDTSDLPRVLALPNPIRLTTQYSKSTVVRYGVLSVEGQHYRVHRWLLDAPPGIEVDHINHDGLDNRRRNIRLATRSVNLANRRMSSYRSRRIVLQHKEDDNRWGAWVFLGEFTNEDDAHAAFSHAEAILNTDGFWESHHYIKNRP
jgi:hypothetical protein